MATFSVNQVRHLYVVPEAVDNTFAKVDQDGALYFNLKDADGNAVRSDLITNILYAKATPAEAMQRKLKAVRITASDSDMVAGQDYVIRIDYRKFISQSDEDTYLEVASARAAKTNDEVEVVLRELAINLEKNTHKQGMVEIKAIVGGVEKAVSELTNASVVTDIIIREIEQEWTLGTKQEEAVAFSVHAVPVIKDTVDYDWATIDDPYTTGATIVGNGKKTADLEYFHLGARGDQYRMKGWPNVIPTRYMVDPTKQYDFIDIHYAYVGANHAVQKSEKDITLVMPAGTPANPNHTIAASVVSKINSTSAVTIIEPDEWNDEE